MKLHTAVARTLVDLKVDMLFGLMGDASMQYIVDYIEAGGDYRSAVDERGAVAMADGYFRVRRQVGIASVTHGPGFTNSLTALVEAVRSGSSLLLITGDTPSVWGKGPRRYHSQSIDISTMVAATGAGYYRVRQASQLVDDVRRAMSMAWLERRPVVLDISADLLNEELSYERPIPLSYERPASQPDPADIDAGLGALASSNRPIILAGRGAVHSGAPDDIMRLADKVGASLMTTIAARGLFTGHLRNVGIFGTLSTSLGSRAIGQADCLLSLGASMNDEMTDFGNLTEGKRLIQVDIDATRIGRFRIPDVGIVADAGSVARAMADILEEADFKRTGTQNDLHKQAADLDLATEFKDTSREGAIDIRTANLRLGESLPDDYNIVSDLGRCVLSAWRYLKAPNPTRLMQTHNFGSIGLGLSMAVGVAAADPDGMTLAVLGDGGAMMGIVEFGTAVRYKLPLAVIVFNDRCYGFEYKRLLSLGQDARHALVDWPSFATLAEAMGGRGIQLNSLEELEALEPRTWNRSSLPLLVEVMADPSVETL